MGLIRPQDMTDAARHHQLKMGRDYANAHDGDLPTNDFWNYLRDRRDINEARFDHWHPVVGRMLRREEDSPPLPPLPPVCMPWSPPPGVPCVEMPEPPPHHVVETPEPSSLVVALAMIFGAILTRRFA